MRTKDSDDIYYPHINCNKPLRISCPVCHVSYVYRYSKTHKSCFQRYCSYCQIAFVSPAQLQEHAQQCHKETWCPLCEQVFEHDLQEHQRRFHFIGSTQQTLQFTTKKKQNKAA